MELSCQNKSISLEWIGRIDPRLTRGNPISSSTSFDRGNEIGNTMKEIKLTRGLTAKVDDEDYDYLMQWKWFAGRTTHKFFTVARTDRTNGIQRKVTMARLIMNTPMNMVCDHVNHDTLDNRKSNLRNCTRSQNSMNRTPIGRSKYLGVSKCNKSRKYMAQIKVAKKTIILGLYYNQWAAAIAYDNAAKVYHKEFANLNFK